MSYTTVKLSRKLKERLEEYARSRGLTFSAAIDSLLEREGLREELKEIKDLLSEQNRLLREILEELRKMKVKEVATEEEEEVYKGVVEDVPSFVRDNPWVEVLAARSSVK